MLFCHTHPQSALTLMGHDQIGRRFEGVSRNVAARLQAQLSPALGCIQYLSHGCRHVGGGGDVQVFLLAVFPAHSAQVPVLANNVALDCVCVGGGGGAPAIMVCNFPCLESTGQAGALHGTPAPS